MTGCILAWDLLPAEPSNPHQSHQTRRFSNEIAVVSQFPSLAWHPSNGVFSSGIGEPQSFPFMPASVRRCHMASSRRYRRRHQQSKRRHRMRLEGLEKRYALDAPKAPYGTEGDIYLPPLDFSCIFKCGPIPRCCRIIFSRGPVFGGLCP